MKNRFIKAEKRIAKRENADDPRGTAQNHVEKHE